MSPTVLELDPLQNRILEVVERSSLTISEIAADIADEATQYEREDVTDAVWSLLADRILWMTSDRKLMLEK